MFGLPPTTAGPALAGLPPPAPYPVLAMFGPYGGVQGNLVPTTSTIWAGTNTAFYMPFQAPARLTVRNFWLYNGGLVSGNLDMGIYDAEGVQLFSTGSTAQSGANALQVVSVTPQELGPGLYYLGLVMDSTNGFVYSTQGRRQGVRLQTSAFPLPARASLGPETGHNLCWWCGLGTRGFV